ncbi:acyltransferase [Salinicoccus sp. HZC-1]|uniref:acyltransferase n=1 Tax=Salinicoccus sp. HZC-1 TaxID=3385497 RepID=UPI00398AA887
MNKLVKQGLKIGKDLRIMGSPDFGSEPYLISIGNHITISSNVRFVTHDGGTWVFRKQEKYKNVIKYGRITIHDNCFIGRDTIILPNVSIGPDSVIAAGSIITKDVPPNTVVAGQPAKVIMSTDEYAEKSFAKNVSYDKKNYKHNKKDELLKVYPYPEIKKSRYQN